MRARFAGATRVIHWVAPILAVGLGPLLCGQVLSTAGDDDVITWFLPLEKAAGMLEQRYGKPVTYEDPVSRWRGELEAYGRDSSGRQLLRVSKHTLALPAGLTPATTPLPDAVNRVIEAYHLQNPDRTQYRVLQSPYGLHIVPRESHDASGKLVSGGSHLDTRITVAKDRRTASEHLKALCAAVSAAAGYTLRYPGSWFDQYFAANGYLLNNKLTGRERPYMLFEWGVTDLSARDALVNLLQESSTTMTWVVNCNLNDAMCWLNMLPLRVGASKTIVAHDRCQDCRPVPKR